MYNKDQLDQALNLLAKILESENANPFHMVIYGGSSLILTGLVTRTTRDVDVLGFINKEKDGLHIQSSKQLPDILKNVSERVADDLGLTKNWLNCGPGDLVKFGLPEGLIERLKSKEYGPALKVSFIGRLDQIYFKVYASVDSGPGRHVSDLLALKPTNKEMEIAVKWVLSQDPSITFRKTLKEMLKVLHYEFIARKI